MKEENNPLALIERATEAGASIDVIERLVALREKINAERAESELRSALSEFQGRCPVIPKTKTVLNKDGSVRYRYAPLDEIVKIVQPILRDCGLSVAVDTEHSDSMLTAIVTVTHVTGARITSRFSVPIAVSDYMSDAQKWASALTYAKRYAYCNALGILTGDEDDDNAIATNAKPTVKPVDAKPAKPKSITETPEYRKLIALPDGLKAKIRSIGLNARQAIELCEKAGWDERKILNELNLWVVA